MVLLRSWLYKAEKANTADGQSTGLRGLMHVEAAESYTAILCQAVSTSSSYGGVVRGF